MGTQAIDGDGGSYAEADFRSFDESRLGLAVWNEKDVARQQPHVLFFAADDSCQIDGDFALLAAGIPANDDGVVGFRGGVESTGEGQHFQCGELGAVVGGNKAAGPANRAQDVNDACVRHGDNVTA